MTNDPNGPPNFFNNPLSPPFIPTAPNNFSNIFFPGSLLNKFFTIPFALPTTPPCLPNDTVGFIGVPAIVGSTPP